MINIEKYSIYILSDILNNRYNIKNIIRDSLNFGGHMIEELEVERQELYKLIDQSGVALLDKKTIEQSQRVDDLIVLFFRGKLRKNIISFKS